MNKIRYIIVFSVGIMLLSAACKKEYYEDSGLQKGVFDASSLQVLKDRPQFFDSLVTIIRLAGMDSVLADSTVTFFAPMNNSIRITMNALNAERYNDFKDSLRLEDVPQPVWHKFLARYIFKGRYMLKDITRWDNSQLGVYPGMNLESYDGYIMNVGVMFSDYNGTKDVGPRTVYITSINDLADPDNYSAAVSTSDIQTKNGIIHVINSSHPFGFNQEDFVNVAESYLQ